MNSEHMGIVGKLDLVEEMDWEQHVDFLTLEEAGLEEPCRSQPSHGYQSVHDYIDWFSDGEDSRYETN